MKRVEIDLPDETFASLDCESAEMATELRAAAAAIWHEIGGVSQKVAAQIAGVSRSEFVSVLSRLQVSPIQEYGRSVSGRATTAPTVKPTVLNASPQIILTRAGYLDLGKLVSPVVVPRTVAMEINAGPPEDPADRFLARPS